MFAMFGASVLVPFVFGINPAIVLFMNGVGTLLFILITKGKAPAYLGSSFAFLAPAGIVITKFGYEYALGSFVAVGFCGCILALLIYKFGSDWIDAVSYTHLDVYKRQDGRKPSENYGITVRNIRSEAHIPSDTGRRRRTF